MVCWAPWLNNQKLHDKVLEERGRLDGTIDKDGNLICDYNVMWFPFGRWVASCEGGYYVTFWGEILPPTSTTAPTHEEQVFKEIIPKFEDYPVKEIFKGTPAPLVSIPDPCSMSKFCHRSNSSRTRRWRFYHHTLEARTD